MESNAKTGLQGEELACAHLLRMGYQILERNWRHYHKEIDIIAQRGDELVVVEVKVRHLSAFGSAIASVSVKQQSNLITAINQYIRSRKLTTSVRFDVIGIDIDRNNQYRLTHIERAFYPRLAHHRPKAIKRK